MRLDRNYDDLFNSIGYATASCTLVVSFGKWLSTNYLPYLLSFISLGAVCLAVYDYIGKYLLTPLNKAPTRNKTAIRHKPKRQRCKSHPPPIRIKIEPPKSSKNSRRKKSSRKTSKDTKRFLDIPGLMMGTNFRRNTFKRSFSFDAGDEGEEGDGKSYQSGLDGLPTKLTPSSQPPNVWKRATKKVTAIKRFEISRSMNTLPKKYSL